MTMEELVAMLTEMKIPFAYDHFAEGGVQIRRLSVICFPAAITFLLTAWLISR